jgi:hypothetical protein
MNSIEQDIELVKSMNDGEECCIFWSEEMGGKVYMNDGVYSLYEVVGYGSFERKYGEFSKDQIKELVSISHTWT